MLDWEANVNPEFAKKNQVFPRPVRPFKETEDAGYHEKWVSYGAPYYSDLYAGLGSEREPRVRQEEPGFSASRSALQGNRRRWLPREVGELRRAVLFRSVCWTGKRT